MPTLRRLYRPEYGTLQIEEATKIGPPRPFTRGGDGPTCLGHSSKCSSAFCPCPGGKTPVCADFTKRDRTQRASLCGLFTSQVECHARGDDDVRLVAVDIDMPCFAERDAVARSPEVLALCKHVCPPVFGSCRPLPDMGRHSVKDLHGISAGCCHPCRVTVVEGFDVFEHRR